MTWRFDVYEPVNAPRSQKRRVKEIWPICCCHHHHLLYHGSITALSRLYQGSITALSRRYQGAIKALSRLYKCSIKALYEGSMKVL
jgi:hypothetical protein